MWGLNRFNRPSATTGIFISLGCIVAIIAGVVVFIEGKKVKAVEGIPVHEYDVFETIEEKQAAQEKAAKKHKKHNKDQEGNERPEGESGRRASTEMEERAQELKLTLTRTHTRTEKIKGKHWYERH
jgi:hypothetical protein